MVFAGRKGSHGPRRSARRSSCAWPARERNARAIEITLPAIKSAATVRRRRCQSALSPVCSATGGLASMCSASSQVTPSTWSIISPHRIVVPAVRFARRVSHNCLKIRAFRGSGQIGNAIASGKVGARPFRGQAHRHPFCAPSTQADIFQHFGVVWVKPVVRYVERRPVFFPLEFLLEPDSLSDFRPQGIAGPGPLPCQATPCA